MAECVGSLFSIRVHFYQTLLVMGGLTTKFRFDIQRCRAPPAHHHTSAGRNILK